MIFNVITIFPEIISQYFSTGVLARAQEKKLIAVKAYDVRDWTADKHRTVDDTPYGGGAGMVMKAEPIYKALQAIRKKIGRGKKHKVVLLSASGKRWTQEQAKEYAKLKSVTLICGRYEGIDARINEFVDEEISLGDFVMTGGEVAAEAIIDSVARLLPGVLGNSGSLDMESHATPGILEYPHYTKPEVLKLGKKIYRVPAVLVSGNHGEIGKWRQAQSIAKANSTAPQPLRPNSPRRKALVRKSSQSRAERSRA